MNTLPINHLSFSAMRDYLNDRAKFERQYIRLQYDKNTPYAIALGSAFHIGVETLWNSGRPNHSSSLMSAKYAADAYLDKIQHSVSYGKTQNYEDAVQIVRKVLSAYQENCVDSLTGGGVHRAVIGVEVGGLTDIYHPDTGEIYPIPLKCKIDQIFDDPIHGLIPTDSKLVSALPEGITPAYELQGVAVHLMTKALYPNKKVANYVLFEQLTKHATPRVVRLSVEMTHERIRRFQYLFGAIVNDLTIHYHHPAYDPTDPVRVPFLPNPFADFGGEKSWEDYVEICSNIGNIGKSKLELPL